MSRLVFSVVTLVLITSQSCWAGEPPSFMGLGELLGGSVSSSAYGISADGTTIVGTSETDDGLTAFRWTEAGGMEPLGDLTGGIWQSSAWGVSADGSAVVGGSRSTNGMEAFRWTSTTGMQPIGDVVGGTFESTLRGISADGTIAVGTCNSVNGKEACKGIDGGGLMGLGDIGSSIFWSEASAVSGDGTVIVGTGRGNTEAFRWTSQNGMEPLGVLDPVNYSSAASAVNFDGSIIVGRSANAQGVTEPFRWAAQTGIIGLGSLPGSNYNSADAVSDDGTVIVGHSDIGFGTGQNIATIWISASGIRPLAQVLLEDYGLALNGWYLSEARGISADGTVITGYGINPSGHYEAWRAIVPEPATAFFLGLSPYVILRRRSQVTNKAPSPLPGLNGGGRLFFHGLAPVATIHWPLSGPEMVAT